MNIFIETDAGGGSGGTHRYWRVDSFVTPNGGIFDISEIQLFDAGSRVDASATVSVSPTPGLGTAPDVNDGNLSTRFGWFSPFGQVDYDFGAPQTVTAIKVGGFNNSTYYPSDLVVSYSDDGVSYTTQASISGLTFPGNNTLSGSIPI